MTPGQKPSEYYRDQGGLHPIFALSSFATASDILAILGSDWVKDTHIDWGTGAGQVSAADVPIADAGGRYTGTEVETALQELAGSGRTTETVKANADAIANKVPATRQIIAGVGLSGGGDLSADRTLAVAIPTLYIEDQKANNTPGGASVTDVWTQRDLNTVLLNSISGASLASNRITLPAGTYFVEASAPAFESQRHKLKLYNYSDSTDILIGSSQHTYTTTNYIVTRSFVKGVFTLAAQKVVELRHRVAVGSAAQGFGVESNFGVIEVYSQIEIRKIA